LTIFFRNFVSENSKEGRDMPYEAGAYDVIVVGAGHAGCEAALAAARMGASTLVLTINLDMVAFMPCNPSIGGPAKGHVVREIDALGGEMGKTIDRTFIQMRMLNTGKGPAVHALRAQADKARYAQMMKHTLENEKNVTLRQALVEQLLIKDERCIGCVTHTGAIFRAQAVVLTTGTYLRGKVIIGETTFESGPNNQCPSITLAEQLAELGFALVRFKTGTPPRVHRDTIDFSKMSAQPGDEEVQFFSSETTERPPMQQVPCWLTYTTAHTHETIVDNLHRAPMYSGVIEGTGPRYCPSIEDKIVRFADKGQHQLFLEPEGTHTAEYYVQGFSTSMPEDVQLRMLRSVPGMEHVEMVRTGYAIEYDAIVPTQLWPTLETKRIARLFTAGQINGTSGYEEAAGQGLIAGINAVHAVRGTKPLILRRDEAYIGVLIDDLVTKGTNEPYRLLTSRAEFRLLLRHDNAHMRLTNIGYAHGLISAQRYERFLDDKQAVEQLQARLRTTKIQPVDEVQRLLTAWGTAPITQTVYAETMLMRPELTVERVLQLMHICTGEQSDYVKDVRAFVDSEIKYRGYIEKQRAQVERLKKMENKRIPHDIDYTHVRGLASEAKEKLARVRPLSIGQAARISGVTPADASILLVYVEQHYRAGGVRTAQ
jgi:tRNA uridine 5-carboxymethylaminomethyl modification enzyme